VMNRRRRKESSTHEAGEDSCLVFPRNEPLGMTGQILEGNSEESIKIVTVHIFSFF
jgi:hypothetical protein